MLICFSSLPIEPDLLPRVSVTFVSVASFRACNLLGGWVGSLAMGLVRIHINRWYSTF